MTAMSLSHLSASLFSPAPLCSHRRFLSTLLSFIDAILRSGWSGGRWHPSECGLCGVCSLYRVLLQQLQLLWGLYRPSAAIFRSLYFLPLHMRVYVSSWCLEFPVGRVGMSCRWSSSFVCLLPVTPLSFASDWCSTSSSHPPHTHTLTHAHLVSFVVVTFLRFD